MRCAHAVTATDPPLVLLARAHVCVCVCLCVCVCAANCLDCERLLSLAFDQFSFLRSFPRARVESLRRKHYARLLAAEEAYDRDYPTRQSGRDSKGNSSPAEIHTPPVLPPVLPLDADDEEDSSDAEGADDEPPASGEYDVVSLDDLTSPARSFWL